MRSIYTMGWIDNSRPCSLSISYQVGQCVSSGHTYKMTAAILSVFVFLCFLVSGTAGGECCLAHYGETLVQDNDEMWCKDYCCHMPTKYYCCDDILFQADTWDRESVCADYFHKNVWAAILIAIACLATIIGCCCCCYCCCCRRGQNTTVFVPQSGTAGPNVTVVNSSTNNMQSSMNSLPNMYPGPSVDPYRAGYDQNSK